MRVFGVFSLTAAICLVTTLCLTAPAAQAQGPCAELIQNGGFENGAAWVLGTAPQMPEYVTYAKHSGNRSLVLGITKGAGQKSYSSARQTVTIPPAANTVTLSFWFNAMMVDPIKGQYMELVLLTPPALCWKSRGVRKTIAGSGTNSTSIFRAGVGAQFKSISMFTMMVKAARPVCS